MTIAEQLEARGEARGEARARSMIINRLIAKNYSIEFIADVTGCSLQEVKKLQGTH